MLRIEMVILATLKCQIVELLISKGANIHDRNSYTGKTPILAASGMGTEPVIELLLSKGADVNDRDKDGNTPLLVALGSVCQESILSKVELLLSKGADVHARNKNGITPIFRAARLFWDPSIAELLLSKGANLNDRDENGNTPIFYADYTVVDLLLSKGADVNARNKKGETPIMQSGWTEERTYLLYGANPGDRRLHKRVRKWPLTMLLYCLKERVEYIPIDAVDMLGHVISDF